jgi:predicted metal-dependent peptidase
MHQKDFQLMNSELKGIWEELAPRKLTMVTCDTEIQDIWEFDAGDSVDRLIFTGRGGTYLEPVFDYALDLPEKPKLIIMASDLECEEPENPGLPVLWLRFGDRGFHPSYGDVIQIDR